MATGRWTAAIIGLFCIAWSVAAAERLPGLHALTDEWSVSGLSSGAPGAEPGSFEDIVMRAMVGRLTASEMEGNVALVQMLADPQAIHRGAKLRAGGGALGEVPMVGCPIRLDGQRIDAPLPPPALGEHGDILSEWVNADELEALKTKGIVG